MMLAVIQAVIIALALVLTIAVPATGLWSLLLLLVLYPIGWARIWVAPRRRAERVTGGGT